MATKVVARDRLKGNLYQNASITVLPYLALMHGHCLQKFLKLLKFFIVEEYLLFVGKET